ncbi:MAG: hypothetical protein ABUL72_02475, partial [Armatimonadota bacterium]
WGSPRCSRERGLSVRSNPGLQPGEGSAKARFNVLWTEVKQSESGLKVRAPLPPDPHPPAPSPLRPES